MEGSAAIVDPENMEEQRVVFRHYVPAKPLSEFVGLFGYWRGLCGINPRCRSR
jgi:hypothetical protein